LSRAIGGIKDFKIVKYPLESLSENVQCRCSEENDYMGNRPKYTMYLLEMILVCDIVQPYIEADTSVILKILYTLGISQFYKRFLQDNLEIL